MKCFVATTIALKSLLELNVKTSDFIPFYSFKAYSRYFPAIEFTLVYEGEAVSAENV